jgi:hypothetical protein
MKDPPCENQTRKDGARAARQDGCTPVQFSDSKEIRLNPPNSGSRVASFLVGPHSK